MIKKEKKQKENKEKNENQLKKKIPRSKKRKNALQNFTIVYENVRELESKIYSGQEINDGYQPNLMCSVETHIHEDEEMIIPEYETIYQNDKTSNSGRIIIVVKSTIKKITMQVKQETEVGQTL